MTEKPPLGALPDSAPAVLVPIRGERRLVRFLSEATGGVGWWLAEPVAPPLSDNEIAIVDCLVGDELRRRQDVWRDAGTRRVAVASRQARGRL